MEPYRTAGFRCPTCPNAPLREYQDRLICDECKGILIGRAEYIASCADLGAQDFQLEISDVKPATKQDGAPIACPRCERAMASVKAKLMPVKVTANALGCDRDGLWFADTELTGVFALVSRRTGGQGGAYYGVTGQRGLDGLPVTRYATSSGTLQISNWKSRPRRRTPTATPVNLYSDQRLPCPMCAASELRFFGDRYLCEQCSGTFVQTAALESMVMDMSGALWDMPAPTGAAGTRGCPVCATPMVVEDLERVPIDRCAEHGVWFDPTELTIALENASNEFEPRGVRAWLKNLFT